MLSSILILLVIEAMPDIALEEKKLDATVDGEDTHDDDDVGEVNLRLFHI